MSETAEQFIRMKIREEISIEYCMIIDLIFIYKSSIIALNVQTMG